MTKLIGIKELQTNIKKIRIDAEKGVHFIVLYRSQPIFEIKPIENTEAFSASLRETNLYNEAFLKRMEEAEENVKKGKSKTYSTEAFLKSLS